MPKKGSKRHLKSYLRSREKELKTVLTHFLNGFNPSLPLDDENNFQLLLRLRWLIYDYLYVRLKLHPAWRKKQWFLELFDVDQVAIETDSATLTGDIVWWAEGKDAIGEWWPTDHEPHPTGVHKIKLRGDLSGGHWVLEPMIARIKIAKVPKRDAEYYIEFGKGNTFLKVTNTR
jgi:hypothetical protein